jgi:hypothetical protein
MTLSMEFANRLATYLFTNVACYKEYGPSWSDSFCKKELGDAFVNIRVELHKEGTEVDKFWEMLEGSNHPQFGKAVKELWELELDSEKFEDSVFRAKAVEILEELQESLKDTNFSDLEVDELFSLGFRRWDSETNNFLIPLYLVPCVTGNATSINGDVIDLSKADLDIRMGVIAYGIACNKVTA